MVGGGCRVGGRWSVEPRARVSVWPGRRHVPGIVAPDSWGARGAECLPRDVPRCSSPATSPCDGTTARRCLCHGTGSGTTEARPPASSVPPAPHGGLGGLSRHPANSGPDFRSSSSSFLPEEIRCRGNPVSVHHSCPGNPVSDHHSCPKRNPVSVHHSCPKRRTDTGLRARGYAGLGRVSRARSTFDVSLPQGSYDATTVHARVLARWRLVRRPPHGSSRCAQPGRKPR